MQQREGEERGGWTAAPKSCRLQPWDEGTVHEVTLVSPF